MHASGLSVEMQAVGLLIRLYVTEEATLLSQGLTESIVRQ